jgi:hypothetical protein
MKSRWQSSFRPHLECLEDRLQPSGLQHPVPDLTPPPLAPSSAVSPIERDAIQNHPLATIAAPVSAPLAPISPVGPQEYLSVKVRSGDSRDNPPVGIHSATYVTGAPGASTAHAVAVDAADNEYVTGMYDDGMSTSAYVNKYLPDGTPDPNFTPVRLQFGLGGGVANTQGLGIAVDGAGNIDMVGNGVDPTTGNQAAFFVQYDPTGTMIINSGMSGGTDTNPYSFNGVTVDAAGNVYITGSMFNPADGLNELTFVTALGGGTPMSYTYPLQASAGSTGVGIAVDPAATTAYIAGSNVDPASGLTQAVLFRVDLADPINGASDRIAGTAAGNWTATAVAVNANGVYFTLDTPIVAAVISLDPTLVNFNNEFDFTDRTATLAGIALDPDGNVFVTGQSRNPTTHNLTMQMTKLTSNLHLVRFVRLGGSGDDAGLGIATTSTGNVVVAGTTDSADFPVTDGTTLQGTSDGFLLNYSF